MTAENDKLRAFVDSVKEHGLEEDLSKAARHHSAANVAEGDKILKTIKDKQKS